MFWSTVATVLLCLSIRRWPWSLHHVYPDHSVVPIHDKYTTQFSNRLSGFRQEGGQGQDPVECKRWWEELQHRYIQPIQNLKPTDQFYKASVALLVTRATLDSILEGLIKIAIEGGSGSAWQQIGWDLEVDTVDIHESVQMKCRMWMVKNDKQLGDKAMQRRSNKLIVTDHHCRPSQDHKSTLCSTSQTNIYRFYLIHAAWGLVLTLFVCMFICCKVLLMANDLKSTKVWEVWGTLDAPGWDCGTYKLFRLVVVVSYTTSLVVRYEGTRNAWAVETALYALQLTQGVLHPFA